MTEEKINAKCLPKQYYCRHMLNGVVKYDNEMILVDVDDMKGMMPSFVGKPVYVMHQPVDVENIHHADGYVTDCFYNELDGWLWSRFLAVSDEAHDAIAKGWSVSNAYLPKQWQNGGVHQNVDYNRKIVNAEFTHLAIVPNPRYEEAAIFTPEAFKEYQAVRKAKIEELKNSKGVKNMFKLFKNTKQEVSTIDADTMVELENGKSVSVQEMVNAVKKNSEEEKKEEKVNMDMEVEVGEEKMPLKELINKYMNMNTKKNSEKEEEKEEEEKANSLTEEEKAAQEKANADAAAAKEAEEAKKAEEEKTNAKHFDELKNAHKKADAVRTIETSQDMLARGQQRYGKN